jgi:hypothetical protein
MPRKPKSTDPVEQAVLSRLNGLATQLPCDKETETQYPNLWAWLSTTVTPMGYKKERAELRIKIEQGDFQVSLSDNSLRMSLTAWSATLPGCFLALEKALASPDAKWSVWRKGKASVEAPNGSAEDGHAEEK